MPGSSSGDFINGGGPSTISDGYQIQSSKSNDIDEKQSPTQMQPNQLTNMTAVNYGGENSNSISH